MAPEHDEAAPAAAPAGPIVGALREAALRAAEAASGGLALVFAHAPTGVPAHGAPPLRSAAGFERPEDARAAATRFTPWVRDAHESGRATPLPADAALLGGSAEGLVLPLAVSGRMRGALLVVSQAVLAPEAREALAAIADTAAVRLDHAALEAQLRRIEEELREKSRRDEERGDEVLKLS